VPPLCLYAVRRCQRVAAAPRYALAPRVLEPRHDPMAILSAGTRVCG